MKGFDNRFDKEGIKEGLLSFQVLKNWDLFYEIVRYAFFRYIFNREYQNF